MSKTSSTAGSVSRASPSTSSAHSSSPASAMFRRQASTFSGIAARGRARGRRGVGRPRRARSSSSRASRRSRAPRSRPAGRRARRGSGPVVGATERARTAGGSPCARSAASSRSRRASTARTRSSSKPAANRHMLRLVRAELTIEVARTPEDVFAYLTDVVEPADVAVGRPQRRRSRTQAAARRRPHPRVAAHARAGAQHDARDHGVRRAAPLLAARARTARCPSTCGTSSSRTTADAADRRRDVGDAGLLPRLRRRGSWRGAPRSSSGRTSSG